MLAGLTDEGLCAAVALCCLLCTLVAERWWGRTRIAMLHPRLFKAMRALERWTVRASREANSSASKGRNGASSPPPTESVAALEAAVAEERRRADEGPWGARVLLPLLLYAAIRFACLVPLHALHGGRELVVVPEYYLWWIGDVRALVGLSSIGVLGWGAVCHAVVSVGLHAMR